MRFFCILLPFFLNSLHPISNHNKNTSFQFQGDTIYVACSLDLDSVQIPEGNPWNGAHSFLEEALEQAETGDQIWMAKGTCLPKEIELGKGIEILKGIKLFGGFSIGDTSLSQREPDTLTTISGNNRIAPVIVCKSLDTIIMKNIAVIKGSSRRSDGGALKIDTSNVILENCDLSNNFAPRGGGIFSRTSSVDLKNCSINA